MCTHTRSHTHMNTFIVHTQSNMMEHVDCNKLCELKFADFSNNRIASIHGYDSCSSLLELNLSENRIARVTGVRGCQGLQRMSLDGNLLINCKVQVYTLVHTYLHDAYTHAHSHVQCNIYMHTHAFRVHVRINTHTHSHVYRVQNTSHSFSTCLVVKTIFLKWKVWSDALSCSPSISVKITYNRYI